VINKHRSDYVKNLQEFEILPNIHGYLKELVSLGFKLIIITNQSAINRGLLAIEELLVMHNSCILDNREKRIGEKIALSR
jgi:D-glycero-D-manno-heptose 1,7-bisphosphate phosphatase